jgi:hypothetical protein
VVVIGIELIRSQIVRNSVIAIIVIFSLVELFVIKDYYNTPTKSEYKELTAGIKQRNKENVKIVTFWSWIFPYYFQDNPSQKFEHAENLEEYVGKMITRSVPIKSFWYADSNGRPIVLSENAQKFMDENFFLKHKLERMDAWANYYVSRRPEEVVINEPIDLSLFKNATFDGTGNLIFIMNSTAIAPAISLEPGNYELAIKGNSLPAKPINGENAHLIAKLGSEKIGDAFLSEVEGAECVIPFSVASKKKARLALEYDNDFGLNGADRNAVINTIIIRKK